MPPQSGLLQEGLPLIEALGADLPPDRLDHKPAQLTCANKDLWVLPDMSCTLPECPSPRKRER